jgi:hypothetical protein
VNKPFTFDAIPIQTLEGKTLEQARITHAQLLEKDLSANAYLRITLMHSKSPNTWGRPTNVTLSRFLTARVLTAYSLQTPDDLIGKEIAAIVSPTYDICGLLPIKYINEHF